MSRPRVYLDHAASTPLDPGVLQAMLPWLQHHPGNPSSIHHEGRQLRAAIEDARRRVADLLGCSPGEIVFTSGGTEADNHAIKGSVWNGTVQRIITARTEHHAVLHAAESCQRLHHTRLDWVNVDAQGRVDLDHLEDLLRNGPYSLVSLMHANNEVGTLLNLEAVGRLCQQYGALFHSDTVQTMGHMAFGLSALPVDFVVASAHKFNGPRGIGFLYARGGVQPSTLLCGGGQERNQRAGTENVAGIVGLVEALNLKLQHREANWAHLQALRSHFKTQLQQRLPGVTFNGPQNDAEALPTVLNARLPVHDPYGTLVFNLDLEGVSASGGSACSSGSQQGSHVLAALGLQPEAVLGSVRFSFGSTTTFEELDLALEAIEKVCHSVKV